ncbi:MAG: hypothetical protein Q7S68_03525 [Deltaproteobacteria bacterium]|nr:hypothetical protein [Deltaproteobacteria bacterium]
MGKTSKKSAGKQLIPEWERLLSAQTIFQSNFPESVLVGGTAAALHVGHRTSLDADYILPDLKKRFAEILKQVETEAGWKTKRIEPPVLILGNFQGVRTGIRQLIRAKPLETTIIKGLRVPTLDEILRIKGALIVKRNATRDYIDFIALFDHLGTIKSLQALSELDQLYPQEERVSVTQQLTLQLVEPKPYDLSQTNLIHYKNLKEPYTDWNEVTRRLAVTGQKIMTEFLKRSEPSL